MKISLPFLVLATFPVGCGGSLPSQGEVPMPVLLARHPEALLEVSVPPDSRGGVEPPLDVPVRGPYKLRRVVGGVVAMDAPIPVRPRSLFFSKPADGMSVLLDGEPLTFRAANSFGRTNRTWSFTADTLTVRLAWDQVPKDGQVVLRYERARDRERGLNRQWAQVSSDRDFVLQSLQQGEVVRTGALLPAPSRAVWRVRVPAGGVFAADAGILGPETADLEPSDGASVTLAVRAGSEETEVGTHVLSPGRFEEERWDLSDWGGQEVDLVVTTHGGASNVGDYVFLGEPTVFTPVDQPPRILLVFIDTLRRDRLGLYGYERDTTPHIDAFAQDATVFEDARSGAPWTLPSVRALLVGGLPEDWGRHETLQERLGKAGYTTAGFVGNVYLSANFDMDPGWSHYAVRNWPRGNVQVDDALRWMDAHPDRPAAVMVHFMDTHLPYREPVLWRNLWAGPTPPKLMGDSFVRSDVIAATRGKDGPKARTFIQDRYDSSIRYVDSETGRILDRARESDVAAVFSDHGEEFWDHNGFEHGHTLYDELLRVPMVVRAPGLPRRKVAEPVNLVDLTPLVLDLAGVDRASLSHWAHHPSLLSLVRDEPGARQVFEDRRQPLGRPLYGNELWGVLAHDRKYVTTKGTESWYDLVEDPGEKTNLARKRGELQELRAELSEAFGWPVHVAFRLEPLSGSGGSDLTVDLTLPGGIKSAWVGADPTLKSEARVAVAGDTASATWSFKLGGTREVFVAPQADPLEAAAGMSLRLQCGKEPKEVPPPASVPPPDGQKHTLLSVRGCGRTLEVTWAIVPQPPAEATAVKGFDPEVAGALKALGYLEDDAPPSPEP